MKRYDNIPAGDLNGLYWYFSDEFDNRTPDSIKEPEPVLVFTHEEDRSSVQMIKRFGGGRQRYLKGYLLGPVQPPLIDTNAIDISTLPQLTKVT